MTDEKRNMQNIGEFSPYHPKMRGATQHNLGLGEYDHSRDMENDQWRAKYQDHADKDRLEKRQKQEKYLAELQQQVKEKQLLLKKRKEDEKHEDDLEVIRMETQWRNLHVDKQGKRINSQDDVPQSRSCCADKSVQTDIKNVNSKLIHYPESLLETSFGVGRDGAVFDTSPQAKSTVNAEDANFPPAMNYGHRHTEDEDRFEKTQKQEKYSAELQQQIKEKQIIVKQHKAEEQQEEALEVIRMETQFRNLHVDKKQGYGRHCYSTEFP